MASLKGNLREPWPRELMARNKIVRLIKLDGAAFMQQKIGLKFYLEPQGQPFINGCLMKQPFSIYSYKDLESSN